MREVGSRDQKPIVTLVQKIIAIKQVTPTADTSALERDIDERVYRLYGLTSEEIRTVEETIKSRRMSDDA